MRNATVTVLDWEGLKQAGEFDPFYLQLSSPARTGSSRKVYSAESALSASEKAQVLMGSFPLAMPE
jgi:hypothetical protein